MIRWIRHWMIATLLLSCAAIPAQAVELQWMDDSGSIHSLQEYQGKAVLVHFWASWCGPCRHEMPQLTSWLKQHPDITIIPISLDSSMADAKSFLQDNHFDLAAQLTDSSQAMRLGARGLPTTLVISANGDIAGRQIGALPWEDQEFSNTILGMLKQ